MTDVLERPEVVDLLSAPAEYAETYALMGPKELMYQYAEAYAQSDQDARQLVLDEVHRRAAAKPLDEQITYLKAYDKRFLGVIKRVENEGSERAVDYYQKMAEAATRPDGSKEPQASSALNTLHDTLLEGMRYTPKHRKQDLQLVADAITEKGEVAAPVEVSEVPISTTAADESESTTEPEPEIIDQRDDRAGEQPTPAFLPELAAPNGSYNNRHNSQNSCPKGLPEIPHAPSRWHRAAHSLGNLSLSRLAPRRAPTDHLWQRATRHTRTALYDFYENHDDDIKWIAGVTAISGLIIGGIVVFVPRQGPSDNEVVPIRHHRPSHEQLCKQLLHKYDLDCLIHEHAGKDTDASRRAHSLGAATVRLQAGESYRVVLPESSPDLDSPANV